MGFAPFSLNDNAKIQIIYYICKFLGIIFTILKKVLKTFGSLDYFSYLCGGKTGYEMDILVAWHE